MSKVDWSLASIHATHAGTFEGKFTCWYMLEGGKWFYSGEFGWEPVTANKPIADLIERPKQPQSWSGPEDGLPPVNTSCQMQDDVGHWVNVLIIANHEGFAHGWHSDSQDCFYSNCVNEFRSTGAIAHDKRESAIRELMDIAQVDCRVTAARLVDAGFKREGV